MSGPIIRSRASRNYAKNWSVAFGAGAGTQKQAPAKTPAAKKTKSVKKKA